MTSMAKRDPEKIARNRIIKNNSGKQLKLHIKENIFNKPLDR